MEILYGAKNGVHAFGYNSAESEPIWMKSGELEYIVGGWPWQILGTIRAVATIRETAEFFLGD